MSVKFTGTVRQWDSSRPGGLNVVDVPTAVEDLLRDLAPQVLGLLVRRYDDFTDTEDALQEALLAAATQWPIQGVPVNPRGWLITVAARRLADMWRSDEARRHRETRVAAGEATTTAEVSNQDDSLLLLFMCSHPALNPSSAIPLTLRAVGGLSAAEIARAFLNARQAHTWVMWCGSHKRAVVTVSA